MSDATASSGARLGRYHLVEPIGGGANGEVHRAKVYGVAGFERQFAVKKFFPHVALSSRYAQALSAAARAYGSLEHPRIARLAEFGVSGGHTFTATELVPGLDAARLLAETLGGGSMIPAGSALALVSQAARAVGYAHGRGISHLGVCPTNLIVSTDGEVKLTDIGILGACLPERPAHDGRFVTRIHYLAPEQLNGEPSSAATDVFSLGLIAYELVTGERPFVGPTPEDVAQAILTGQPREPQLPRPIMRVLQRCLARSPYERFPDARALADALDAALRVSPVPGTRAETGELVGVAQRRIAVLHDQALSGALSLNLPTAGVTLRADTERQGDGLDLPTMPFNRESERTIPAMNAPSTTMQGMAPPPIPVPQGVAQPPPVPPGPMSSATLQGIPPARMPRPQTAVPPPLPRQARVDEATQSTRRPSTGIPIAGPGSSGRIPPLPRPVTDPGRFGTSEPTNDARRMTTGEPIEDPRRSTTGELVPDPRRSTTGEPVELPINMLPMGPAAGHSPPNPPLKTEQVHLDGRRRGVKVALAILAVGVIAGGGIVAWQMLGSDSAGPSGKPRGGSGTGAMVAKDAATVAVSARDAAAVAVTQRDAATTGPATDASRLALAPDDAASPTAPTDAAKVATAPTDAAQVATAPSDAGGGAASGDLTLDSKPPGARVFIDGADHGATPLTLPGSNDRYSIALVLPGHDLYIAEIDGHGRFAIDLVEVTPSGGPAGIKVKCKDKTRYYVFLDGKPTGQLCPTERLEVPLGDHVIEIYDLVSETRHQYPVTVRDTRLSVRVKIDYH